MSFSVDAPAAGVTYRGGRFLRQPHVLGNRTARRLLAEIARFLVVARGDLARGLEGQSLTDYVRRRGFADELLSLYLVPMASAIWSMPPAGAAQMPATFVLRFFDNHALLGFRRHKWRTVVGGARRYVDALAATLPGPVHLGEPVTSIRRHGRVVEVVRGADAPRRFEAVVLATHGDQALELLADADELERSILGAFRTTPNRATLHFDERMLPRQASSRASWNVTAGEDGAPPRLTYYANELQRLRTRHHYCITLNAEQSVDPDRVLASFDYRHPAYDAEAIAAQGRLHEVNGHRATYYCGAWQGWGFHEDGLRSAVRACAALGVSW
jgi:predicted NAD/FAD-binding protein